MSLADARRDMLEIVQGDFSTEITLTSLAGFSVSVNGIASKHHLGINPENGNPVNTKNAHVSLPESVLIEKGYTVRNSIGEVSLIGHIVQYADSTGNIKKYRINEAMPDETLGLIVCILGDSN